MKKKSIYAKIQNTYYSHTYFGPTLYYSFPLKIILRLPLKIKCNTQFEAYEKNLHLFIASQTSI